MGKTTILCTASVVEEVPQFLKGKNSGWVTAEYSMIPASTDVRMIRERNRGKTSGRTLEIQRLIGRSLRAVVDLKLLGQRTVWLDCDVLQADGGSRTAAINGCSIVLYDAMQKLLTKGLVKHSPMNELVGSVSVGIISNFPLLDLSYEEDFRADVDMNVVMTESGKFIEVQGTAEGEPFSKDDLDTFLELGADGIKKIIGIQKESISAG
jgi:ribonuclease PH